MGRYPLPMLELLHSLVFRPYVTIFLLAFLALGWMEQGKLRTLIWLVTGYFVALAAEWGSINHGIPFGIYVYHYDELKNDLIVFGVPFFDSLSFSFLSYVSFSFAQYFMSPLWAEGFDLQRVTPRETRNSASVLFLGAMLMTVLDLVIDPLAHLGRHWFLGDIYHYPAPGVHFDVTLANYMGWFIVGWVIIFINQRIDRLLAWREFKLKRHPRIPHVPFKGAFAPLFWAGIALFMLGITYYLAWAEGSGVEDRPRVQLQALTGTFLILPILVFALLQRFKPANMAREDDVRTWLAEYPNDKLRARLDGSP